ncbi:MAG: alpha/beta hydrolase [Patescibacteria group bacterium]
MSKRVFIIHGWSGYPEEGWFPWLKKELESRSFEVSVPVMPNTDEPKIKEWVPYLAELVGEPDENTYLVGHSIGCQTILRYLESIDRKVGGAVFVAGWFVLSDLETEEEKRIRKPWIETPVDFVKIKQNAPKVVAIFSKDDDVVPFEENKNKFEKELSAKIIIENGKGHFSGSDGVTELPSVLEAILGMFK